MCEMTPDCDGRTGQLGRCRECGADQFDSVSFSEASDVQEFATRTTDHEPAKFSGGAGVRTHPLSDEDYRREMEKIGGG